MAEDSKEDKLKAAAEALAAQVFNFLLAGQSAAAILNAGLERTSQAYGPLPVDIPHIPVGGPPLLGAPTPARDVTAGAPKARVASPRALQLTIPTGSKRSSPPGKHGGGGSPPASPAKHPPPLFDGSMQHAKEQQQQPQPQHYQQLDAEAARELLHTASNMQELKHQLPGLLHYPASDASATLGPLLAELGGAAGGTNGGHLGRPSGRPPAAVAGATGGSKRQHGPDSPASGEGSPQAAQQQQQQQQQQRQAQQQDVAGVERAGPGSQAAGAGGGEAVQPEAEVLASGRPSLRSKRRRTLKFRQVADADPAPAAAATAAAVQAGDGGGSSSEGSPGVQAPGASAGTAPAAEQAPAPAQAGGSGVPQQSPTAPRRRTPMHAMATHALRQLPGLRGSLRQVATLIKNHPHFSQELDTSARPGTRAYPRWKDALVSVFKNRHDHLVKTEQVDSEGHAIYALLPDRLTEPAAAELARCLEAEAAAAAAAAAAGGSSGGSAPTHSAGEAAALADTLTEVVSAVGTEEKQEEQQQEYQQQQECQQAGGGDHASSRAAEVGQQLPLAAG